MEKKRSIGISVLGWVEIIISIILLILCIVLISGDLLLDYKFHGFGVSIGMFGWIFPIFILVTGIFTLKLRPAGRILNFVLAGMFLTQSLPIVLMFLITVFIRSRQQLYPSFMLILPGVLIIISLCLIYFLTRPKVEAQFK